MMTDGCMTNAERDRLLIEMNASLKQINRKLDRDGNALYGDDGHPGEGLVARVSKLEQDQRLTQRHYGVIAAVAGFIISTAIAVISLVAK